jgi:hypothetical protein
MAKVQIRVTLPDDPVGGTKLELSMPLGSGAPFRLGSALARLQVNSLSRYVVRAGDRLIVHAKLSERDGSPLSRRRVGEVMTQLQRLLSGEPAAPLDSGPGLGPRPPAMANRPAGPDTAAAAA